MISRGKKHNKILQLITNGIEHFDGLTFSAEGMLDYIKKSGENVTIATIRKHLNHRAKSEKCPLQKFGKNYRKTSDVCNKTPESE